MRQLGPLRDSWEHISSLVIKDQSRHLLIPCNSRSSNTLHLTLSSAPTPLPRNKKLYLDISPCILVSTTTRYALIHRAHSVRLSVPYDHYLHTQLSISTFRLPPRDGSGVDGLFPRIPCISFQACSNSTALTNHVHSLEQLHHQSKADSFFLPIK